MTRTATRRPSREAREWALFLDWCTSTKAPALPTTSDTIAAFLAAFPASLDAQGHRVRTIRRAHARAGEPLELPSTPPRSALQSGDGWASLPDALANLSPYQHRKYFAQAMRARRDGWLLVLIGVVGLSRAEARSVMQAEVTLFPSLSIRDVPIPKSDPAAACAACAVTRWLRIVGAASRHWWTDVKESVTPDQDQLSHDCRSSLDGVWREAETLLPAIDQYGHVTSDPMSPKSITAVMKRRQRVGGSVDRDQVIRTVSTGRFARATPNELADAYDDVDAQLAAVLLRSAQILQESDEMLDRISSLTRPVEATPPGR
ncbi:MULTISPECIES: hypothetical protein [unclassified Microbacterium]|uniref:hypothetical protein n=1 Tax=unclassified Microbacterium TaxID=2609290 RepID=UPI00288329E3|nr:MULTISPECIES: hypothetical protein [unclassified Microbacterium]